MAKMPLYNKISVIIYDIYFGQIALRRLMEMGGESKDSKEVPPFQLYADPSTILGAEAHKSDNLGVFCSISTSSVIGVF